MSCCCCKSTAVGHCPCRSVRTVFGREFRAYFDSPVAYVFLVAFLVLRAS